MDHNLDYNGLPSAEELQLLANAYFSEPPTEGLGFSPQQVAEPFVISNHLQNSGSVADANTLDHANPNFVSDYQNSSSISKNLEYGKLPGSVTGSGISPSVIDKENKFDIDDPQTSLLDPHFEDGKISKPVSGGGVSPSLVKKEYQVTDGSFESELKRILKEIISFVPSAQLPARNTGFIEPSFYFLGATNYFNEINTGGIAKPSSMLNPPFDINKVKQDFPILQTKVNGKEIVWLDNAATTQKPKQVIERISYFYENENSNIHRAAHELAARATDAHEAARKKVQHFLNARSVNEIVFVRGTTEAINLVASSWGDQYLNAGDEIIVSHLEHHANIVPWQLLSKKKGISIKVIPVDDDGQIILEEYGKLLNAKTKLVSFTQVSNALGTITPAKLMVEMAHRVGAKTLVDGAQSVSHMRTDVQTLNADFFVFSGHKVFGPTGIGVLHGKEELLNQMQPYQGGGNMIKDVTFEHTEFHQAPSRFEAGTGNIADAVGLGAAIDYVSKIGMELIGQYEHALLQYGTALLKTVPGIRLIGTAQEKASVMSFILKGFTNDEVGQALNKEGIAVRTGHHCAQPILRRFGVESTVRPSLAFYNTCSDVDRLIDTLYRLVKSKVP
jgi:cysteine desulfurase / selenocysteine lyase